VNSISNSNKLVTYGNTTTRDSSLLGLPTNVVSVMQCVFGLLGATKLGLLAFGLVKWHLHSNLHSNEFLTWNSHSMNANF